MLWHSQVLLIAPESGERDNLEKIFQASDVLVFTCSTLLEAQSFLSGQLASAVFAHTDLPDGDFRTLLADVARFQKDVPVIALMQASDTNSDIDTIYGAFDCLTLPAIKSEAQRVLRSALQASPARLDDQVAVA